MSSFTVLFVMALLGRSLAADLSLKEEQVWSTWNLNGVGGISYHTGLREMYWVISEDRVHYIGWRVDDQDKNTVVRGTEGSFTKGSNFKNAVFFDGGDRLFLYEDDTLWYDASIARYIRGSYHSFISGGLNDPALDIEVGATAWMELRDRYSTQRLLVYTTNKPLKADQCEASNCFRIWVGIADSTRRNVGYYSLRYDVDRDSQRIVSMALFETLDSERYGIFLEDNGSAYLVNLDRSTERELAGCSSLSSSCKDVEKLSKKKINIPSARLAEFKQYGSLHVMHRDDNGAIINEKDELLLIAITNNERTSNPTIVRWYTMDMSQTGLRLWKKIPKPTFLSVLKGIFGFN